MQFKSEGAGAPKNKIGGPRPMRLPRFHHLCLPPWVSRWGKSWSERYTNNRELSFTYYFPLWKMMLLMTSSSVTRVWQAWHVPRAPLRRGRKNCLAKIKIFIYNSLNLYFALHTFINCKAASTQRPHLTTQRPHPALSRACCASTITHYDKTVVLWHNMRVRHCDRTKTLACHIHETSSFSLYTIVYRDKSVCAAAFQARRWH